MRVVAKEGLLIVVPADDVESALLDGFGAASEGHVFRLTHAGTGLQLSDLGPEEDACNHPINITSQSPPPFDLISNFAHTPFTLDGRAYAGIEGFWQSLAFADPAERERVGALFGAEAKQATAGMTKPDTFEYDGRSVRAGTYDHWQLMRRATVAKFEQDTDARSALLSTGDRPLVHRVRHDSRVIPGVIMADIWMAIRHRLQRAEAGTALSEP